MAKIILSVKGILNLIYMRTILEIVIEYDEENGKIIKHNLSPIGMRCYGYIVNAEKNAFRIDPKLYRKASAISKIAYPRSRDKFPDHEIYLEPLVYGLYFSQEKAMKQMLVLSGVFNNLFDDYWIKHDCKLERESMKPIDCLWEETDKAIFEYKKLEKRGEV